jgi:hypothetical protein
VGKATVKATFSGRLVQSRKMTPTLRRGGVSKVSAPRVPPRTIRSLRGGIALARRAMNIADHLFGWQLRRRDGGDLRQAS